MKEYNDEISNALWNDGPKIEEEKEDDMIYEINKFLPYVKAAAAGLTTFIITKNIDTSVIICAIVFTSPWGQR